MTENVKTAVFLCVAFVAVCLAGLVTYWNAILGGASIAGTGPASMVGQHLVEEFDPLKAVSLEIVEFDEDTAAVRPFLVAQTDVKEGKRLWCIPSHDNYPADAEEHLAEAATSLMGLTVLSLASDSPGDHELYGVKAPDPTLLKVGATGVGTQVTMKDLAGKTLVSLIIGKEVPGQSGLRYVRRVGEDAVYVVELKADKLSTKFEDWIEEDLLKLNPWDIRQVWIRDYSVDELRGTILQRGEMVLEYDDMADPRWRMVQDTRFEQGEMVAVEMAPDEKLDTARLDDLKYALDDLKIVDVRRKPPGLSADLRATGDFEKNREAVESLAACGFYVARVDGQVELFSNEGEIRVLMKDGVEYVLRFGEIAGSSGGEKKEDQPASAEGAERPSETAGLNRYLFVTAQFNPDGIPKPEIKELPPEEPAQQPANGQGSSTGAGEGSAAAPSGQDSRGEDQTQSGATNSAAGTAAPADDQPSADQADAGQAQEPPAQAGGSQTATAEETTAQSEAASADQSQSEAQQQSDAESERERIKRENQRAQEEYQQKLEDGRKRVDELNARFADWYYIISDEVYRKIHLSRENIVTKKESAEEGQKGEEEQPAGHEEGTQTGTSGEETPAGQSGTEQPAGAQPAGAEQPGPESPSGQPSVEEQSAATQPPATQPGAEPGEDQSRPQPRGEQPATGEQGSAKTPGQDQSPVDVFDRLKDAGPEGPQPDN